MTTTFAGVPCTRSQIVHTLALLRWHVHFLSSPCEETNDGKTKPEARRSLAFLIHVAINRKGGVWEYGGYAPLNHRGGWSRKYDYNYELDMRRAARMLNGRFFIGSHTLPTSLRERFAHRIDETA